MRTWLIGLIQGIAFLSSVSTPAFAADVKRLASFFKQNFDALYEPRFCGPNIARLINAARENKIDLEGAFVLKIEGAGFLETSGFCTRTAPDKWAQLGYFHFVLIAENRVFDFDLHQPVVPEIKNYIRLQFSPAQEPTMVFGMRYRARDELKWWTVSRIELRDFVQGTGRVSWKGKLGELVDLDAILSRPRVSCNDLRR